MKQRVVREPNARHDVAGAERDLFCLREVLVHIAVQLILANILHRNQFLRPDLGSVQRVELKLVLISFGDHLNTEVPLGESAVVNGFVQVLSMEVGILASKLKRLVPIKAEDSNAWLEVELDEEALALGVVQGIGVHTESLHHAV